MLVFFFDIICCSPYLIVAALNMTCRPKMIVFVYFVAVLLCFLPSLLQVEGFTTSFSFNRRSQTILYAKSILSKSILFKKRINDVNAQPRLSNSTTAVIGSTSIVRSTAENIIRSEFTEANKLHQLHKIDWVQGRCEIIVSAIPQQQQPISEPEVTPTVDELQALQTRIYTKLEAQEELTSLLAVTEASNC